MPELPEVETIRLQLLSIISGKIISSIEVLKSKSFIGDAEKILQSKILGIRRFAKILVIDLNNDLSLAVHLKMSGQLIYKDNNQGLPNKHTRVVINFTDGSRLFFNDMRMFGWIKVADKDQLKNLINKIGPDPLKELTQDQFKQILQSSKKPVKLVLMDQEKIAGVGNIYTNEALFLSGIHPKKAANSIPLKKAEVLFSNLKKVLEAGIKWGGTSSNLYLNALGEKGQAQEHLYIYDRQGLACQNNCGSKIEKMKLGGRGTYYCPNCQKL